MVIMAVRRPMRAHARAASQPACPGAHHDHVVPGRLHGVQFLVWHTGCPLCLGFRDTSMKILVIGSGGREHALCWKLAQSQP